MCAAFPWLPGSPWRTGCVPAFPLLLPWWHCRIPELRTLGRTLKCKILMGRSGVSHCVLHLLVSSSIWVLAFNNAPLLDSWSFQLSIREDNSLCPENFSFYYHGRTRVHSKHKGLRWAGKCASSLERVFCCPSARLRSPWLNLAHEPRPVELS